MTVEQRAGLAATGDWEVRLVALGDIHPSPWNPRSITQEDFEALVRSLEHWPRFLLERPCIVQASTGDIAGGNMRYRGMARLASQGGRYPSLYRLPDGRPGVPARVRDMTDAEARAFALIDNNLLGEYQPEETGAILQELRDVGIDPETLAFKAVDLEEFLEAAGGGSGREHVEFDADTDPIPEPPAEPITRPGDVWHLGAHRLACGDAGRRADLDRLLGGVRPQLVVTSPPYNQEIDGFRPSGMQRENPAFVRRMAAAYPDTLPEEEYQAEQVRILDLLWDVTDPLASLFYNHKLRYRKMRMLSPLEWLLRTRWERRQEVIWDRKSSITLNARMFVPCDERLYWLFKGQDFTFADTTEIKSWGTVWDIPPRNELQVGAPFPNALAERCVLACSAPGDAVLDPFAGTGTVLMAADRHDRVGYALERDPAYCDVILARWTRATGGTAVRPADGRAWEDVGGD